MEIAKAELDLLGTTEGVAVEVAMKELGEIELALVGGGGGEVIFA